RQANTRAPGETAVGIGHEGRPLLVTRRNEGDAGAEERIQDVQDFLAGQAEDMAHPLVLEALDDEIGSFHADSVMLRSSRGRDSAEHAAGALAMTGRGSALTIPPAASSFVPGGRFHRPMGKSAIMALSRTADIHSPGERTRIWQPYRKRASATCTESCRDTSSARRCPDSWLSSRATTRFTWRPSAPSRSANPHPWSGTRSSR